MVACVRLNSAAPGIKSEPQALEAIKCVKTPTSVP